MDTSKESVFQGPIADREEVRRAEDLYALVEAGQATVEHSVDAQGNQIITIRDAAGQILRFDNKTAVLKHLDQYNRRRQQASERSKEGVDGPIGMEIEDEDATLLESIRKKGNNQKDN